LTEVQRSQIAPLREEIAQLRQLLRDGLSRPAGPAGTPTMPQVPASADTPVAEPAPSVPKTVSTPEIEAPSELFGGLEALPSGADSALNAWTEERLARMQDELDRIEKSLCGTTATTSRD
jgi:hypothetical protein